MATTMGESTTMTRSFLKLGEQGKVRALILGILMESLPQEPGSPPQPCPPPGRSAAPAPSTHRTDPDTATACHPRAPGRADDELRRSAHRRPRQSRPATAESLYFACQCPGSDQR